MWVTDLFLSLPQLPLLLLLIFLFREPLKQAFGLEVGIFMLIVVVIGGFRWMPVARLVRAARHGRWCATSCPTAWAR
jgi:peptide/nickel transport system permease protein